MEETDRRYPFLKRGIYERIKNEVSKALDEALDVIKKQSIPDYTLLISCADYNKVSDDKHPARYDYRINNYTSINDDQTLVEVKNRYLGMAYSPKHIITEDSIYYVFMEIALYSETLESRKHIREIYRIFSLLSGNTFEWKLTGRLGKYRNGISEMVERLNDNAQYKLSQIYENVFNIDNEIRNFFAHNDFVIDFEDKLIRYSKKKQSIDFEEWTKKFLYQSELCCQLYEKMDKRRLSFNEDTNKDKVEVTIPDNKGNDQTYTVSYKVYKSENGYEPKFIVVK